MIDPTHDEHAAEAKERWGDTEAYRQSAARTKGYSDEDWVRVKGEMEAIEAGFADVMASGASPEDDRATDLAEQARLHIDGRYYSCSHTMHAALADMYTADERFKAHYDDRAPGLADFVSAAIKANAARHA